MMTFREWSRIDMLRERHEGDDGSFTGHSDGVPGYISGMGRQKSGVTWY